MVQLEEPAFIYAVGTAGSGKTRFTQAFAEWSQNQGVDTVTVNLDPGAEFLPYTPDVDIRDWIRLQDVMDEYDLGPNGAQILAADLLALKVGEIKEVLEGFRTDYFLMDTPGQTELFVFRESGRLTMDALSRGRTMIAFLMDPFLANRPSAFVSQLMLSATTQFRFQTPTMNVLTKTDLMKKEDIDRLLSWGADPMILEEALSAETADMYNQLNFDLFKVLDGMGASTDLIPVSSGTKEGFDDVYSRMQGVFAGGEDTQSGREEGYGAF